MIVGPVAQRLEQLSHKESVSGSIPLRPISTFDGLQNFGEPKQMFTFPEPLMERYAPPKTALLGITDKRTGQTARYTRIDDMVYPSKKDGFYYDTIHYIIPFLAKNNKAVGCLGFELVDYTKIVVIQLQGSKGFKTKIKWDKLLLHTLCDWAFNDTPVTEIRMIDSAHVPYWSPERQEQLYLRYDVLSRRMGFRRLSEEAGNPFDIKAHILFNPEIGYAFQSITPEMYFKKFPDLLR